MRRRATDIRKGSPRWAARVAEWTAWGTVVLIAFVFTVADLEWPDLARGIALLVALGIWLLVFFRYLLFRPQQRRLVTWIGVLVDVAFATGFYVLLRGEVSSAQLIFVPVIVATGLLGTVWEAVAVSLLAVACYAAAARLGTSATEVVTGALNAGIFLLSGSVAGLLARELRTHYRGEQKEHRLATAVRHRLLAVLDAVDEGIVFSDRQGIARVVNRRAGELFQVNPDSFLGFPVVELLRAIARETEDPEEFMETFQRARDDPGVELRVAIEQIIPQRRLLRLYSAPTYDDEGGLVGRIDVYTDITEAAKRAAEVERLYEEARKTAESYQRSLLPETPPRLPRVSLVAHYLPAAGRRAVCGDFYDYITLPNGRLGLVLGDVCGVGPRAANDAALARYTLRSLATQETEPGQLLSLMNRQVHSQLTSERFVRLLVGSLDPERALLDYANAGHVPPVLFRAKDGSVEWLGEGGLALGVEEDADYKVGRIQLDPGDMVVFYTDGVTEAPRNGRPFGQGKFSDIVAQYGVGTPGELVHALRRSLDAWVSRGNLRDDVALVVCQVVPDATLHEPARELVLPNEPARVPEVRAFVSAFLADVRAPVDTSSEVLLAVGEAAANACRHGRTPGKVSDMRVRCRAEAGRVVVTVADDGPGFDPANVDHDDLPDKFASGGRGLFLMHQLVDDLQVESSSSGTTVTLARDLAPRPDEAGDGIIGA